MCFYGTSSELSHTFCGIRLEQLRTRFTQLTITSHTLCSYSVTPSLSLASAFHCCALVFAATNWCCKRRTRRAVNGTMLIHSSTRSRGIVTNESCVLPRVGTSTQVSVLRRSCSTKITTDDGLSVCVKCALRLTHAHILLECSLHVATVFDTTERHVTWVAPLSIASTCFPTKRSKTDACDATLRIFPSSRV